MEKSPVKTIPIHEHLRPRLCDTYENDSIFDKFEVVFSGDAKNVMTGSYNNNFMIYPSDNDKDTEVVLQADKSAFKAKKVGIPTPMNSSTSPTGSNTSKKGSWTRATYEEGNRRRPDRLQQEDLTHELASIRRQHRYRGNKQRKHICPPKIMTILTICSFSSSPHCKGSLDSRISPEDTCKPEH
jgi:hypothetical protein